MSRSQLVRNLARALRLKASWFMDPPTLSRSVTVRVTLGQLRDLREELDRAAFALDEFANRLGRDEGEKLAQFGADSTDGRNAHRKRALAVSALLEELGFSENLGG